MKINIVCVGKIKEKFFTDAINEYLKRISRFADLKIIEVDEASKLSNLEQKSKVEGEKLLQKCSGVIVALDGGGKLLSSTEIADYIHKKEVQGESTISFVIGGSNGLSKELLSRADLILSFGKITFPHQLFRVVLTEQIYRALTIIEGLPYHK
ncbi:MAG: 23S rRNA (pseudouridine(1915)-N(3))-methyltransferase RlmH [Clostridia bacterium]|nr:23S rRNA (pseudouridine(1915)-N(3))-methyltransferase RlmH [Clostridia bacterium]